MPKPIKYEDYTPVDEPVGNYTPKAGDAIVIEPETGITGALKGAGNEIMRGVRRVGQDLGISQDPNQYKKTPQGEAIANSDAAKGARNYVRAYKEGLGIKSKNDQYEKKKGGLIKTASKRADGIAQRGKTRGKMVMCGGGRV
jgi:hypothetical protein